MAATLVVLPARTVGEPAILTIPFGSQYALTIVYGAQPICPPITICARLLRDAPGVSLWWSEGPPNWLNIPSAQAFPLLLHRRIVYLVAP
jgi:hypothetical protein